MGITGKNRQKIVLIGIVTTIVLAGYGVYRLSRRETGSASETASTFTVTRGALVMSVTESGTIKARNAVEIKSQVEGQATIVSLVPEGSYVTAQDVADGEILVELDSSRLRDEANQQQITYNSAEADYTEANEALVIQKNQNDSDIQQGLMNVKFALMDLQKYLGGQTADKVVDLHKTDPNQRPQITALLDDPNQLGGESLQRYRELKSNIDLAHEEYKRASTDLEWTQKLFEKKYVSRSDLDADRLKVQRLEVNWDQAKTSLDLFTRYEFPKQAEKLFSDYLEAERQLERIYAQTRSQLAQAQARLSSSEAKYLLNKERLERIEKQIEACTMRAMESGLVIYASSSSRRFRGGSRTNIDIGEQVYERELIMTITNAMEMDIDVKVHETNVDKVRVGQLAKIVIDAQPDKVFAGEVIKIAPLPDPQSFFGNPDLKVYATDVSLEGAGDTVKPGMSAKVEIIIAQLADVLSIPTQCVANRGGRKVCYLMTNSGPSEQAIETGVFNDRFVQVLGGLRVGQKVLLSPPRLMMDKSRKQDISDDIAGLKKDSKKSDEAGPATNEAHQVGAIEKTEAVKQSAPGGRPDPMKRFDTNGDGKIDLSSEVPEQARSFMTGLDANQDGFIDKNEMQAAAKNFGEQSGQPGRKRPRWPQGDQGRPR
ncbi:MAG: efflux RND transporter periplasmic adaptor subunit [Planctomycetota bacterium]